MSTQPVNTEVDPQALANARNLWNNFTCWMTYGVIAIACLLIVLVTLFV